MQRAEFNCELAVTGKLHSHQQLAWVYKNNFFAANLFDQALISMYKTGEKDTVIGQLLKRHVEASDGACPVRHENIVDDVEDENADVLLLQQFVSLIIIMGGVMVFGLAGSTYERLYKKTPQLEEQYGQKKMSNVSTEEFQEMLHETIKELLEEKTDKAQQGVRNSDIVTDVIVGENDSSISYEKAEELEMPTIPNPLINNQQDFNLPNRRRRSSIKLNKLV